MPASDDYPPCSLTPGKDCVNIERTSSAPLTVNFGGAIGKRLPDSTQLTILLSL